MDRCRNCSVAQVRDLGFIGVLAPFFLKRVVNAELVTRYSANRRKRWTQDLFAGLERLVERIRPHAVGVELQSCLSCSFLQTKHPFSDESLSRLYTDYRSDSYNKERSIYEPHYALVADQIGSHTEGGLSRVDALTAWLRSRVSLDGRAMLDFGGADGQFLPLFNGHKYVYEISDIAPAPGVQRIAEESSLQTYPYVQLAHVLEHVTEPLQLTRRVSELVEKGGHLLIEVPQDLSTDTLTQLQRGSVDASFTIHEHINFYSVLSLRTLIEAANLEVISIEAVAIDSPMGKQTFIRGLARQPQ